MAEHTHSVCPVWVGHILASPFRRLFQNPDRMLAPYMQEGFTALDVGPGMGFFTLPLATFAGEGGKVYAVDLQEEMLSALMKKAAKKRLANRIETRVCQGDSLCIDDLAGSIDVALLFAVAHEVPDQDALFRQLASVVTRGGTLLFSEPKGHVDKDAFAQSVSIAVRSGFVTQEGFTAGKSHAVAFTRA